jgi:hypothetical protein
MSFSSIDIERCNLRHVRVGDTYFGRPNRSRKDIKDYEVRITGFDETGVIVEPHTKFKQGARHIPFAALLIQWELIAFNNDPSAEIVHTPTGHLREFIPSELGVY